ncbi:hypothetical protein [Corynebacterium liangguodongii]|uniref:Uncharacterized protein n=1 Tax=Corynebacterium liangguodongii TaxID=2079535 RepID=A0A2S0WG22_9CORY|nr:hypothetical protein [Corynebacterium liangguodongii]AWB84723.1 hypothetical protein C3E79_09755 [Corynebacterium liangguodongii]PWB99731.1 hypothetical protein DF219_05535 [Corynebacterium liangguodongii]
MATNPQLFSETIDLLRADAPRIRAELYAGIVGALPRGASMFPAGASEVSHELIDALVYTFTAAQRTGTLPEAAVKKLQAWALDLRRFGFPPEAYPVFARVVREALGAGIAARLVLDEAAEEMARAAAAADISGVPPAAAARVVGVDKLGDISRVRLTAGMALSYAPGQFMPVMHTAEPGVWVNLAPALPANPFGQLEFHLRGELRPRLGDYLTLGAARGASPRLERGTLHVRARSTGSAAAQAIIFAALELDAPPRTTVDLDDSPATAAIRAAAGENGWLHLGPDDGAAEVVVCGPAGEVGPHAAGDVLICPDSPPDWSYQDFYQG